jgi:hypothetical protein
MLLYYDIIFVIMENKPSHNKVLLVTIIITVAATISYIGYHEVFAQSSNQSSGSKSSAVSNQAGPNVPYNPAPSSNPHLYPPFNQSKIFPNNTESIKSLNNLTGSNTPFLKGKPLSNTNNSIANSLSTNSFQSH